MRKRKREWFDDDSFWRELYPYLFTDVRAKAAEESVVPLLKLAKPPGKEVLDLCCGPGRFAVPLAKRGYRVTGVDRTKFYLAKARAYAIRKGARVELVNKDMRDFERPESFDLVINMFTSFGYFDNKDEDLAVLRKVFSSLRPGGVLLIDTMSRERLAKIFQPVVAEVEADGAILVQRHEIFDDWTRIRNEWIIIRGKMVKRFRFHHTIYSGQELREKLEQAGFVGVKLYGGLAGETFGPESTRLIDVGRKPKRPR